MYQRKTTDLYILTVYSNGEYKKIACAKYETLLYDIIYEIKTGRANFGGPVEITHKRIKGDWLAAARDILKSENITISTFNSGAPYFARVAI